jgi:pimeloyl-ACP methyl ester carboxylesterase
MVVETAPFFWTLTNFFPRSSLAEKYASSNGGDPSHVVLVGHSSGSQAALRYAEKYAVDGIVLVSATYSDLGDAHECASGYYPQQRKNSKDETNPYLFGEMKKNCPLWHQFHSDDDPFIPLCEAERIRDGLGLSDTYHMLPGRSHFFDYSPELLDAVLTFFLNDDK